jgi:hypothetical protein
MILACDGFQYGSAYERWNLKAENEFFRSSHAHGVPLFKAKQTGKRYRRAWHTAPFRERPATPRYNLRFFDPSDEIRSVHVHSR